MKKTCLLGRGFHDTKSNQGALFKTCRFNMGDLTRSEISLLAEDINRNISADEGFVKAIQVDCFSIDCNKDVALGQRLCIVGRPLCFGASQSPLISHTAEHGCMSVKLFQKDPIGKSLPPTTRLSTSSPFSITPMVLLLTKFESSASCDEDGTRKTSACNAFCSEPIKEKHSCRSSSGGSPSRLTIKLQTHTAA